MMNRAIPGTPAPQLEPVAPGIWRIRFGAPEVHTPLEYRVAPIATAALDRMQDCDLLFEAADFTFETTPRGVVLRYTLSQREMLYGMGLQLKSHNQRGLKKHLRVNSDPVSDAGDSHAPVPFYVSTSGYGLYVDTARYVTFNFGTHSDLDPTKEKDTSGRGRAYWMTDEQLLLVQPDESGEGEHLKNRMVIEVPAVAGVDVYLFAGPTMVEAVQRYTLFSGGGCLPPFWGLGVWYRTYAFATEQSALAQAKTFRDEGIPVDVFGLEPTWHTHCYSCSYLWDPEKFPEPQRFIDGIRSMGYHLNLWEHAYVHPTSPIYKDMIPCSGDTEVWKGLVPDFTLEEARAVFADYHEKVFVEKGVSGFKLDECDSGDLRPTPWGFPNYTKFPSGLDGEQMHSLFGLLYQKTLNAIYRKQDLRTLNQVRSTYALGSSLPFVLYSDLYDHADYIRGVVNMGFSGLLWSPEVRYCFSTEDLVRRVQSVVFSPHALVNAFQIKNSPWFNWDEKPNNEGIPMDDREFATNTVRGIFRLRMELVPYLYAAFSRYALEGVPTVKAMVLGWPDDPATYDLDSQYMFGEDFLVAPMLSGQTSRTVYLPDGGWYDFWTEERIEGGRTLMITPELQHIPLYVREGTILPLAEPVESIARDTVFQIRAIVYGSDPRPCTLFEDDGETYGYEQGAYNKFTLTFDGTQVSEHREGSYHGRRYALAGWRKV